MIVAEFENVNNHNYRIHQANVEGASVVDVDGSHLYQKYKNLSDTGQQLAPLGHPTLPLSSWTTLHLKIISKLLKIFLLLQLVSKLLNKNYELQVIVIEHLQV